jgi:hypothetical protein
MSIMITDGNIVALMNTWKGKGGNINISDDILNLIDDMQKDSIILLHSHPDDLSFSPDDIKFLCRHLSIKEIRVVQRNGKVHTLSIGKKGYRPNTKKDKDGKSEFSKVFDEVSEKVINFFIEELKSEKLSQNELNECFTHERCKQLADKYDGWVYK